MSLWERLKVRLRERLCDGVLLLRVLRRMRRVSVHMRRRRNLRLAVWWQLRVWYWVLCVRSGRGGRRGIGIHRWVCMRVGGVSVW